jgi:hypothetical protein
MSVVSDVSLASRSLECPVCKRELAARSVFLHLKSKHQGYFQQQTTKKWLQESQLGRPLKVFWEVKNDFDEPELIVLFGCLSSGKTFNLEHKGLLHFKKNPSDLKDHNRLVSELIKTRNIDLASQKPKQLIGLVPEKQEYMDMKKNNDPELCLALLDVIDNHLIVCTKLEKDANEYLDIGSRVHNSNAAGSKKEHTILELIEILEKWKRIIQERPMNFKILSNALAFLWHFIHIRKFFISGYSAPELDYPWFMSRDHPLGELSYGSSRFQKYIWPWESPMNPIDNTTSWIEI